MDLEIAVPLSFLVFGGAALLGGWALSYRAAVRDRSRSHVGLRLQAVGGGVCMLSVSLLAILTLVREQLFVLVVFVIPPIVIGILMISQARSGTRT